MKNIITVSGPITPAQLGYCQCHEHLMLRKGPSCEINPALCIDDVTKSCEEVSRFYNHGGRSIIDAQPVGCGRMALELSHISKASGVHIIASTGFHKLEFYHPDHWIHNISKQDLTDLFIAELTVGMFTDADFHQPVEQYRSCAGIIKTAYDKEELSTRYRRLFDAAMTASLETGRVISVHIEQGTDPVTLLDYMTSFGMDAHNIMFCHLDRACADLSIHEKLLSRGVYLEYDTIGRFRYHDDMHEISIIKSMIRQGFEDQLLFSLDTTRERLQSYTPEAIGLDYILRTFIPQMQKNGITQEQILKISNKNCIALFAH